MNTWLTLVLYMVTGGLSILFMYFAQKARKSKTKKFFVLSKKIRIKKTWVFLGLSFLPLFLLLALRGASVGADYSVYERAYVGIREGTLTEQQNSWLGAGFKAIVSIFSSFLGLDFRVFLVVIGFFTLFFFFKTIWEEGDNPALSLATFLAACLFYQMFNQFRQMFAIALVFYSIRFINTRKLWKFILVILVSASMHISALVFLPMYFIGQIKISKKVMLIYAAICIFVFFGYDLVAYILSNTYYGQTYFGSSYDVSAKVSVVANTLLRVVILAVCLPFYSQMDKANHKNRVLYHMLIICVIVQFLTLRSYVFGRISTYFFIASILLIPNILTNVFPGRRIIMAVFVAFLLSYHTVYFMSDNAVESGYREYTPVFVENKEMDND